MERWEKRYLGKLADISGRNPVIMAIFWGERKFKNRRNKQKKTKTLKQQNEKHGIDGGIRHGYWAT